MAFNSFLKIQGIDGESTDSTHKAWIEILSFGWNATNLAAPAGTTGGGASVGKVSTQGFTFTKMTDSASPSLFLRCCTGSHFAKVSVAVKLVTDSNDGPDFVKIDFYDVLLTTLNPGGNRGTDLRPLEAVSFNFSKIEFQAAPLMTDGSLGSFVRGGFDFQTNQVFAPSPPPITDGGY